MDEEGFGRPRKERSRLPTGAPRPTPEKDERLFLAQPGNNLSHVFSCAQPAHWQAALFSTAAVSP